MHLLNPPVRTGGGGGGQSYLQRLQDGYPGMCVEPCVALRGVSGLGSRWRQGTDGKR